MKQEIIKNLEKSLEKQTKKLENDKSLVAFEKALKEFEELIDRGVAKRRSYNLMTIEGKHRTRFSVNSNLI